MPTTTDVKSRNADTKPRHDGEDRHEKAEQHKQNDELSSKLRDNLDRIRRDLGIGISFDVNIREFAIAGERGAAIFYLTNFFKDIDIQQMISRLQLAGLDEVHNAHTAQRLLSHDIGIAEVKMSGSYEHLLGQVLAGPVAILIDGDPNALIIDLRVYPTRSVSEPQAERVLRGPHTGFVESLIVNTNLIRRHVRAPSLRMEITRVGRRSKTDVVIAYLNDLAKPELVADVKKRISSLHIDALSGSAKGLEEYITGRGWNPLPRVRYTERPDIVAAHLLEGFVAIIVDTSPIAMILPATFFSLTQAAEDFYTSSSNGTYMRCIRLFAILISLVLGPLWLAMVHDHSLLPHSLSWVGPQKVGPIPLVLQLLILEVGIDLIRTALIHTPSPMSTSLGIVGAILLGQVAIKVGLLAPEPILYVAIVAIAFFSTPSLELGMALRLFRYFLYLGAAVSGLLGLGAAFILVVLYMGRTKSFGIPYLWPLIPFRRVPLTHFVLRVPQPSVHKRPKFVVGRDRDTSSHAEFKGGNDSPLEP